MATGRDLGSRPFYVWDADFGQDRLKFVDMKSNFVDK